MIDDRDRRRKGFRCSQSAIGRHWPTILFEVASTVALVLRWDQNGENSLRSPASPSVRFPTALGKYRPTLLDEVMITERAAAERQGAQTTMLLENYFEFLSENDIRIKGHRLGIDTVLEPFLNGFSPETIAQDYPELSLEEIYATITYYFHRQTEIEAGSTLICV